MEKHEIYWWKASKILKDIVGRLTVTFDNSDIKKQMDDILKKISIEKENVRYADRDDRIYIMEDLYKLRIKRIELDDHYILNEKFIQSPYFNKITTTSNQTYFISSYMSDFTENIVMYTAPIAALRFKNVGQGDNINGQQYIIAEKESVKIIDKNLLYLEHTDNVFSFEFDGNVVKYKDIRHKTKDDIEVKKESLKDQIIDNSKSELMKSQTLDSIADKMREEQDRIMRAPYQGVTLIKGPAGSGKTNIAFHRIVYLINEHPDKFKQNNIAVFCFNVSLKKYLTDLVRKLDITSVQVNSIDEWMYQKIRELSDVRVDYNQDNHNRRIKSRKQIVDIILEFLYSKQKEILFDLRNDLDLCKFEKFYIELERNSKVFSLIDFINLRKYVKYQIINNKSILNKAEQMNMIESKLEKIMNSHYFSNFSWNYAHIKFAAISIMNSFKRFKYYEKYLANNGNYDRSNSQGSIKASDMFIFGWIALMVLRGFEKKYFGKFDHIIVDEVQDFTPIQMLFIDKLHNNSMTIAGDIAQKIFDNGVESWNEFGLNIDRSYELVMCHRSTLETILFANQLIGKNNENYKSSFVAKRGEKPYVMVCNNSMDVINKTISTIKGLRKTEPNSSIVVVYPKDRNNELLTINKLFNNNKIKSYVAKRSNWEFTDMIAITTYHQIKGLQFDYVFILGLNEFESGYFSNKENILYTTITRAQKRVFINCINDIPMMIKNVDEDLYSIFNYD